MSGSSKASILLGGGAVARLILSIAVAQHSETSILLWGACAILAFSVVLYKCQKRYVRVVRLGSQPAHRALTPLKQLFVGGSPRINHIFLECTNPCAPIMIHFKRVHGCWEYALAECENVAV